MAVVHYVIYSALLTAVFAEIAVLKPCQNSNVEDCVVSEVRINPCKPGRRCSLKRGENSSISFDFTPNFDTSNLKAALYWASPTGDVPFAGLESDNACLLTNCPTVSGNSQVFNYNLYLGTKLPPGSFDIKWKLWNADNEKQGCCFVSWIKIKKQAFHKN